MSSDRKTGKSLEDLAASIEAMQLPEGTNVEMRKRIYREGVQVAECDVEITGKLGTRTFKWVIECRDRPSDGPQGTEWIDALIGKHKRFMPDCLVAVSSTGFTRGAQMLAADNRIELRALGDFDPRELPGFVEFRFYRRTPTLRTILLVARSDADSGAVAWLQGNITADLEVEVAGKKGSKRFTLLMLFQRGVERAREKLDREAEGKDAHDFIIKVDATKKEGLRVESPRGSIQLARIEFGGLMEYERQTLKPTTALSYNEATSGAALVRAARFDFNSRQGDGYEVDLHFVEGEEAWYIATRHRPTDPEGETEG